MAPDKGNHRWPHVDDGPNILEHHNDPLREIWQGRWKKLPRFHKVGTVVCLGFALLIIRTFLGVPLQRASGWSEIGNIVLVFAAVGLMLALFFAVLVRSVR